MTKKREIGNVFFMLLAYSVGVSIGYHVGKHAADRWYATRDRARTITVSGTPDSGIHDKIYMIGRAISGPVSTDTVKATDETVVVTHSETATGAITQTLPTATTLGNAHFVYSYANLSQQCDVINPTTWTIQSMKSLSVPPGAYVRIIVDPNNATNWLADCVGCENVVCTKSSVRFEKRGRRE